MKASRYRRWWLRPEGLLILLACCWFLLYVLIAHVGFDVSIFIFLTIHWPEPTIYWPLVLFAFAGIYFLTRNYRQWKSLQYFHVASLFAVPVVLYLWAPLLGNTAEHYGFPNDAMRQDWVQETSRYTAFVNSVIVPGGGVLIFAGLIAFIINVIAGFIRGKKVHV